MRIKRGPYTDNTLARAIRNGVDADGRTLNYLMPHFALNETDMAALTDYLKNLSRQPLRGVSNTVLHFATIITPDADPVKSKGMLAVLQRFFDDRNVVPLGVTPRLRSSRKLKFMVNRRWQLHVWQLSGPADTWEAQLNEDLTREPVFAVVSGMGGSNWAPVHDFCEHQALPCLFPNVEAPPPDADHDFYSLYFSRGVLLEAGLIADGILGRGDSNGDGHETKPVKVGLTAESAKKVKVVQIYRAGDNGETASRALATRLSKQGITVNFIKLPAEAPRQKVSEALKRAAGADTLVLWLRPDDIAALGDSPPATASIYMSSLMGGLENAPLPASWRQRVRFAYPFDLPNRRIVGVDFAFGWFRIRHIPVVAPQVQADTYLAIGLLSETLHHMADTFVPDYLVERMEDMLDHRIVTGYYPRLTLAPGQRFASKGGYIVHFPGPKGTVVADSDWLVP